METWLFVRACLGGIWRTYCFMLCASVTHALIQSDRQTDMQPCIQVAEYQYDVSYCWSQHRLTHPVCVCVCVMWSVILHCLQYIIGRSAGRSVSVCVAGASSSLIGDAWQNVVILLAGQTNALHSSHSCQQCPAAPPPLHRPLPPPSPTDVMTLNSVIVQEHGHTHRQRERERGGWSSEVLSL